MTKAFGSLFGSGSSQQSTSSSSTPTAYQSLSPQQQAAYNQSLQTGTSLAANPSNFAPAAVNQQQTTAANYFAQPVTPISSDALNSGIQQYSNPFIQDVINYSTNDLNNEAGQINSNINSQADAAGGFGSTRQGILQAQLQKNLLNSVGQMSANANSSNFNNAVTNTLNQYNTANSQTASNMANEGNLGNTFEQIQTGIQDAPATANSYLAQLSAMLQGGGATSNAGTVASGAQSGALNYLGGAFNSTPAQGAAGSSNISSLLSGLGGLGSLALGLL